MWQRLVSGTALRRIALAGALTAMFVVGLVSPRSAEACSGVPPSLLDPQVTGVIVGRILEVAHEEKRAEHPLDPITLTLTIQVERYLFGSGPATLMMQDALSATAGTEAITWQGLCPTFKSDPTATYLVVAVFADYESLSPFSVYGQGPTLDDPDIQLGIDRVLTELAQVAPAPVGNAGLLDERAGGSSTALALVVLGLVVAAGVAVRHAGRRR